MTKAELLVAIADYRPDSEVHFSAKNIGFPMVMPVRIIEYIPPLDSVEGIKKDTSRPPLILLKSV